MKKALIALLLLGAACATRPPQTPAESFASLESRLSSAKTMDLEFDITASGALAVHATGSIHAKGSDLLMNVTGESSGVETTAAFDANSPALRRDVIAGGLRMGVLHNVVRLLGQMPIEKADRAEVRNVAYVEGERKYSFDIAFDGEPIAAAGLWIGANGLPSRRQQTIRFPEGSVFVEEHYTWH